MALILGVDPGSRITGYGLINAAGSRLEYVDCGCIRTEAGPLPQRLQQIFDGLTTIIERYSPQQAAIEEVFMGRNAASALKLGQARGSAIIACLRHQLPLEEYSARKVKQAIVGRGAAEKHQVQHMVKALLGINQNLQEDAADALAIAICHANTQASLVRMAGARRFSKRRLKI
ncbi:MAG: crossover junction endodeoxyribonuclease RuvC [Gammaproteobacteria bacterium]|nr:crossover junction endodeoxyribonuclease RuvC [Pseudomonadales bacterium]MCP5345967.1 crossover junction endodeoxyribonuclease RuvC [Pseudomonadales bacterium]